MPFSLHTLLKYSIINELFSGGVPIWVDDKPKIAHNKIMIVDNQKVITGSFNLSKTAKKGNAENLLIITLQQYVKTGKHECHSLINMLSTNQEHLLKISSKNSKRELFY